MILQFSLNRAVVIGYAQSYYRKVQSHTLLDNILEDGSISDSGNITERSLSFGDFRDSCNVIVIDSNNNINSVPATFF